MIGGGTGGRALFIGRARVELHHLPCISLFFSQPGEVDSLRRAESFFGRLRQRERIQNNHFR